MIRRRVHRSDVSIRQHVQRVATSLCKGRSGPDVLCGHLSLSVVLSAAQLYQSNGPALRTAGGKAHLKRHIRAVERWMRQAREIEDDAIHAIEHQEIDT